MLAVAGTRVQYESVSTGQWFDSRILQANTETADVEVECKPGVWVPMSRVRPLASVGAPVQLLIEGQWHNTTVASVYPCGRVLTRMGVVELEEQQSRLRSCPLSLKALDPLPNDDQIQGAMVHYHSTSLGKWLQTSVLNVMEKDFETLVELDCKPGAWVQLANVRGPAAMSGMTVEYESASLGKWCESTIVQANRALDEFELACKPGVWTPLQKLRGKGAMSSAWDRAAGRHFTTATIDPIGLEAIEVLKEGSPKLLSALWLLQNLGGLDHLGRCQDLPDEAFVPPSAAAHMLRFGASTWNGRMPRVVALSYPWLAREHPDPDGFHMTTIKRYLAAHLKALIELAVSGMENIEDLTRLDIDVGVFWDFVSLPQYPRTDQDSAIFTAGLKAINLLYGASDATIVVMLKRMPAEVSHKHMTPNALHYNKRGWCEFEQQVSSITKLPTLLCDLSAFTDGNIASNFWAGSYVPPIDRGLAVRGGSGPITPLARVLANCGKLSLVGVINDSVSWDGLTAFCTSCSAAATRKPTIIPPDMNLVLANRTFTNSSDLQMVCNKYSTFFNKLAGHLEVLDLSAPKVSQGSKSSYVNIEWTDEEIHLLCRALPKFAQCHTLRFMGHRIQTQTAVVALAEALIQMPSLETVDFGFSDDQYSGYEDDFKATSMDPLGANILLAMLSTNKPGLKGLEHFKR